MKIWIKRKLKKPLYPYFARISNATIIVTVITMLRNILNKIYKKIKVLKEWKASEGLKFLERLKIYSGSEVFKFLIYSANSNSYFSFFLLLQSFLQTLPSACYTCHKWQKYHKLLEWLCTGMHGCTWVWVGACGYARVCVWDKLPNVICCIQCLLLCCLLDVFCCISMLWHMLRHWTI